MKTKLALLTGILSLFGYAFAQNPDGDLRIEVTTAYNFIVDSNVETPATYAPRAAYISARIWNDGPTDLTDVVAYVGNGTTNTPGVYPSVTNPTTGQVGTFQLVHEGGSGGTTDATRYIGTIPAGGYAPVYWLVSYPNLDDNGDSVTGGIKPDDDLVLDYSVWATDGTLSAQVDRTATMRNSISAMANKIFPNTANKVPQEYQDLLEKYEPDWNSLAADGSPGTSIVTEGVWYDLGNVGGGFDNNGDLVPDQNAWLQPVGDPSLLDSSAFRLVNTYTLLVVKLKSGGEQVLDVRDQLYFENLPENNGVIGLVRYDFLPLKPNSTAQLTPYQMAASGFDNEKFNGDYGAGIGGPESIASPLTLDKTVVNSTTAQDPGLNADPGDQLDYSIVFTNPGTQTVGDPATGDPVVIQDSIPANTDFLLGSASLSGGLAYSVRYSDDNGATWTTTAPANQTEADLVTDLQWWLEEAFDPGENGTATFSVLIDNPATDVAVIPNLAGLSFGDTDPFLTDNVQTLLNGVNTISGTVFLDDGGTTGTYGSGTQDGDESGIEFVTVTLYYDANGDGVVDDGDTLVSTFPDTPSTGDYSFTDLPDGNYLVVVDEDDTDITSQGYTATSPVLLDVPLSGGDSSGNDFGFAPTLTLTKTGTVSAMEGDPVVYTVTVTNQYPDDGSSQSAVSTIYAKSGSPLNDTTFVDEPNAYDFALAPAPLGPNGTVATTDFSASSSDTLILDGYSYSSTGVIETVNLVLTYTAPGTFLANDEIVVSVLYNGTPLPTTATLLASNFLASGTIELDLTSDRAWTAVDFALLEVDITATKQGGSRTGLTGEFGIDQAGFVISERPTLTLVPFTDTYNADELTFVGATVGGASPDPNENTVAGSVGTLSWDNIGPLDPQTSKVVVLNFIANDLLNNVPLTTLDEAEVTGARFNSGTFANDVSDTAETDIFAGGSIGDTIFFDINQDGLQDVNDPGVPGVTVLLYEASDLLNPVDAVVTDANGLYIFEGLDAGDYVVQVDTTSSPLVGAVLTSDPDSDGEPCTGPLANGCDSQNSTSLTLGQTYAGADFGYFLPGGVIDGTLWKDFDGDGVIDDTETVIAFVTVSLKPPAGVDLGNGPGVAITTTTDENGYYSFGGLDDGTYTVTVTTSELPTGLTQTFDFDGTLDSKTTATIVSAGSATRDFGYRYPGDNTLSGTIGLDGDTPDGLMGGLATSGVDGDETAFENVTVYATLWNDDGDGIVEAGETQLIGTTTSDANGDYAFANLPEGDGDDFYVISMTPPIGNLALTTEAVDTGVDYLVESTNSQGFTVGAYQAVTIPTEPTDDLSNIDFAFVSQVEYDFGDLPASYSVLLPNGPRHIVSTPLTPTLALGSTVDTETNGTVSVDSTAEGADDDGVTVTGIWQNGSGGGSLDVEILGSGYLVGYIDWNNDGDFLDAGELVLSESVTSGTISRTLDVPDGTLSETSTTSLYSRFRLLPTEPFIPELAFTGEASNGEVEDYLSEFHAISGTVFVDTNTDNLFGGDTLQPGVVIDLYKDGVLVASTVTDLNGDYAFYGLPLDDYEIRMTTPTVATAIRDVEGSLTDASISQTLSSSLADQDFLISTGVTQRAIRGTVFVDTNADTLFGGDDPVENVSVNLYRDLNNDGIADDNEFIGTFPTDVNGDYSFTGLAVSANYLVEVEANSIRDIDTSTPNDNGVLGLIKVDVTSGDAEDQDFLTDYNATISGVVEIDTDDDNAGDDPQSGVTIELLDENDNVLTTTTAAGDGSYSFTDLGPGTYRVQQTVPTNYVAVNDVDGADLTVIGDVTLITVAGYENITGQDFVNSFNDVSIGDFVWADVDGDGIQDSGEPGLNGVRVNLLDNLGAVAETTLTAPDGGGNPGYYEFTGLDAGSYEIEFVLPSGYAFTTQDAGADDALDSDADPADDGQTGQTVYVNGDTDITLDAGLLSADLELVKTVVPGAINVGETITYTLTLTNLGPTRTTGVEVTDVLPAEISFQAYTGPETFSTVTGVWTVGELLAGETTSLTFVATVNSGTAGDDLVNSASVTASDVPDRDLTNNQDTAEVHVSELTISKTSNVVGTAAFGDTIQYTIVVENIGAITEDNVVVVDELPEGLTYVDGSVSAVMTNVSPLPTATYTNTVAGASTFTVPPGAGAMTVELWGAGGSGTSSGVTNGGGGAGGGGYVRGIIPQGNVTPGDVYDFTIGAGGGPPGVGNDGNAGGDTEFLDGITLLLRAGGGAGGGAVPLGGAGGGSNNLIDGSLTSPLDLLGGAGGDGSTNANPRAGGGGGSSASASGAGVNGDPGIGSGPGIGATAPSGGGDGGDGGFSTTNRAEDGTAPGGGGGGCSGAGAGIGGDGQLVVTYDLIGEVGTDGPAPTLASGYVLAPGATLTITFNATVDGPVESDTLLNTASVTSTQTPVPVQDSVEDPLSVGSISGTIEIDTDNDGSIGDAPHEGVLVALLDAAGDPVLDSDGLARTAVTDSNGDYSFDLLDHRISYQVTQTVPNGFTAIGDVDGGDFTQIGDQSLITVTGGADTSGQDFLNTQYGTLEFPDFCLSVNGTTDGSFIRPVDMPSNVVYKLEYADELGDPTTWDGTVTLTGANTTVTPNGDGTETVTVTDVPTLTGLTSGFGFVRLLIELDADNDNTPDETEISAVSGWVDSEFGASCRTYNNPFLSCSPLTSTVSSVSGQDLVLADVIPTLGAGTYYIEVTSGDNEGQRFDIASYTGSTLTLAWDADLCDLVAPFNTLLGAPPADLAADTVVIRKHRTLNEVFPVDEMTAANDQVDADQITLWDGAAFVCYYLYDDVTPKWVAVGDGSLTDVGDTIIPPGHGSFVNSRGTKTLRAYGQVRENEFVRPLCQGVNLVAGGYPIDQSPAGRAMSLPTFSGNPDYKYADRLEIWSGDTVQGAIEYNLYYLVEWGPIQRWVRQADYSYTARDTEILLLRDRSTMQTLLQDIFTHSHPTPWSP